MPTIRKIIYLDVTGMLLVSGCKAQAPATSLPEKVEPAATPTVTQLASTATPEPLPELDPAVKAALSLCENALPGQVCLVEGPVRVTAQPERFLMPFREPGQTLNLADIQTLKLVTSSNAEGQPSKLPQPDPRASLSSIRRQAAACPTQ